MANRIPVVVPSPASIQESMKLQNLTENQIADDYLQHPPLPRNQEVVIDKLGILNFNLLTKQHLGMLRYGAFRIKRPDLFPECKDPKLEYEDEDQVSPVVVISGDKKYMTDQVLWFPLSDVVSGITKQQGKTGKKLLPIKVFIDDRNQWMVPLMNLSRGIKPPQNK